MLREVVNEQTHLVITDPTVHGVGPCWGAGPWGRGGAARQGRGRGGGSGRKAGWVQRGSKCPWQSPSSEPGSAVYTLCVTRYQKQVRFPPYRGLDGET